MSKSMVHRQKWVYLGLYQKGFWSKSNSNFSLKFAEGIDSEKNRKQMAQIGQKVKGIKL